MFTFKIFNKFIKNNGIDFNANLNRLFIISHFTSYKLYF